MLFQKATVHALQRFGDLGKVVQPLEPQHAHGIQKWVPDWPLVPPVLGIVVHVGGVGRIRLPIDLVFVAVERMDFGF